MTFDIFIKTLLLFLKFLEIPKPLLNFKKFQEKSVKKSMFNFLYSILVLRYGTQISEDVTI